VEIQNARRAPAADRFDVFRISGKPSKPAGERRLRDELVEKRNLPETRSATKRIR
jgi:hypothetical protein